MALLPAIPEADRQADGEMAGAGKASGESGTGPILERGKRDRSDIVKLGGPADVRAIFNRSERRKRVGGESGSGPLLAIWASRKVA